MNLGITELLLTGSFLKKGLPLHDLFMQFGDDEAGLVQRQRRRRPTVSEPLRNIFSQFEPAPPHLDQIVTLTENLAYEHGRVLALLFAAPSTIFPPMANEEVHQNEMLEIAKGVRFWGGVEGPPTSIKRPLS